MMNDSRGLLRIVAGGGNLSRLSDSMRVAGVRLAWGVSGQMGKALVHVV